MGSRADTWVFCGLAALVVWAPLPLGSNRPWAWSLLALGVGALLLLWFGALTLRGRPQPLPARRLRAPLVLFVSVCGWILIQWLPFTPGAWHHPIWADAGGVLGRELPGRISVNPDRTLEAFVRLLSYAGVFWLSLQLCRSRERAHRGLVVIAWAGAVHAVYGLLVQFSGSERILWMEKWAYPDVVTGTFVNRNSYATHAGLGLVVCLGLALRSLGPALGSVRVGRERARLLIEHLLGPAAPLLAAILVIATALLLTGSRAGTLSTLFALFVLLAAALHGRMVDRRAAGAASLALLIAGAALFAMSGEELGARIQRTDAEELRGGRGAVYAVVGRAIRDTPLLGTGYGSFPDVFPLYRDAGVEGHESWQKAHNTYLEQALELGLPAAAALWIAVLLCAHRCWLGVRLRRRGRVYPAIGAAATALVAIHSAVDFSVQIPAVAVTFCFVLGIGCAQSWPTQSA